MANVLTVDGVQAVRIAEREKLIRVNCVLSGNYVQAPARGTNGGELIDLTKVVGIAGKEGQFWGPKGPARGYPLQGPAGFSAQLIPGADALHWVLKIWSSAGNEHAAGAYEASITGDLDFYLEFTGLGGGQS
jgi:hypothetical protein